jgi:hypothetical protein
MSISIGRVWPVDFLHKLRAGGRIGKDAARLPEVRCILVLNFMQLPPVTDSFLGRG